MSCFSILEKLILKRCYPNQAPPVLEEREIPKQASNIQPARPESMPAPAPEVYVTPQQKRRAKQEPDEEDLFKELEPTYQAPKRVTTVVLTKEKHSQEPQASSRFNMELEEHGDWGADEIVLDN
jgi:hypothetical protein